MKLTVPYILALFLMSLFVGVIIISIGVGTDFTPINTVMAPLVCPGDKIIPVWEYRGSLDTGVGPDLRYRWICVNESTGEAHVVGYRTIFTAGTVYALLITGGTIAGILRTNKQIKDKTIS
jgi:hypothetical protein